MSFLETSLDHAREPVSVGRATVTRAEGSVLGTENTHYFDREQRS